MLSIFAKTSFNIQNNDRRTIERIAYEGTKYTSILVALLCFPIMLSARELLMLYVGVEYSYLSPWLFLWVFTLTLSLHNSLSLVWFWLQEPRCLYLVLLVRVLHQ